MHIYIYICKYIYKWTIRLIRRTHTNTSWVRVRSLAIPGEHPKHNNVGIYIYYLYVYIYIIYMYIFIIIYLQIYIYIYMYIYWKLLEDSAMLQLPQQLAQTNLFQENHLGLSQIRNAPQTWWWYMVIKEKEKQWEIIGFLWVPYFDICLEEKNEPIYWMETFNQCSHMAHSQIRCLHFEFLWFVHLMNTTLS